MWIAHENKAPMALTTRGPKRSVRPLAVGDIPTLLPETKVKANATEAREQKRRRHDGVGVLGKPTCTNQLRNWNMRASADEGSSSSCTCGDASNEHDCLILVRSPQSSPVTHHPLTVFHGPLSSSSPSNLLSAVLFFQNPRTGMAPLRSGSCICMLLLLSPKSNSSAKSSDTSMTSPATYYPLQYQTQLNQCIRESGAPLSLPPTIPNCPNHVLEIW